MTERIIGAGVRFGALRGTLIFLVLTFTACGTLQRTDSRESGSLNSRVREQVTLPHSGSTIEDASVEARRTESLAEAAEKGRRWKEAAELWDRSATLLRSAEVKSTDLLRVAYRAATAYLRLGDLRAARQVGEQRLHDSIAMFGQIDVEVGKAHNTLGTIHRRAGDFSGAVGHYEKALAIFEDVLPELSEEKAATLGNLAIAANSLGDFERGIALAQKSLVIDQALFGDDDLKVTYSLGTLAFLHMVAGDLQSALKTFARVVQIKENSVGLTPDEMILPLGNLGTVYSKLGDHSRAIELFKRSMLIEASVKGERHPDLALGHMAIGLSQLAQNELQTALQSFDKAVTLSQAAQNPSSPALSQMLTNRALVLQRLGHAHLAAEEFARANQVFPSSLPRGHWRRGITLVLTASLSLELGDVSGAERIANEAFEIVMIAGNRSLDWQAFDLMRRLYQQKNEPEVAVYWGKQAINTLQAHRSRLTDIDRELRQGFLLDKRGAYTGLADLLVQLGRLLEAERVMLMLREEEMLDFVQRDGASDAGALRASAVGPSEAGAAEQLVTLRERISSLERELSILRSKARLGMTPEESVHRAGLERALERAAHDLSSYLETLPVRFAAERRVTSADRPVDAITVLPGSARLQFIVARDRVSVIVTTVAGRSASTQNISATDLASKVSAYRQAIQSRRDVIHLATTLYAALLQPLEEQLASTRVTRLDLLLDGALRYLPFSSLHDGKRYLVERFAISLASETRSGERPTMRLRRWESTGLGLTRALPGFPALPTVRKELVALQTEVKRSETYLDDGFTRDRLMKTFNSPTAIVHIASHFRFQPGTEIESFLVLGDGQRMTLRDFRTASLKLNGIELLTLSACETGLGGGRDETGIEIDGLGLLLQRLGAHSVMATLWPIADGATAPLMQQLYRHRIRDRLDGESALRIAQLHLLNGGGGERFKHPFYWSAFVLFGR